MSFDGIMHPDQVGPKVLGSKPFLFNKILCEHSLLMASGIEKHAEFSA